MSLSDKAFWEVYNRRELLHLLQRRWRDLPLDKRERLERRLVNGRARYEGEAGADYNRNRSIRSSGSAKILGWLIKQGCELSGATQRPCLTSVVPTHVGVPEWDETADRSYDARGGTFRTDSDPSLIIAAPLGQIIPLAEKHTRTSFDTLTTDRPFDGLVEQRPSRAVAALRNAERQGDYPVEFWGSAMQNWPDEAQHRLVWLFGARLARLPSEIVVELQHDVFWWLTKHLPELAAQDQPAL